MIQLVPTKSEASTPTIISSFSEFEEIFGTLDSRFYVPYTPKQYLKSFGTVTIVRVLSIGGYQLTTLTFSFQVQLINSDESYSHEKLLSVLPTNKTSK